MRMRPFLMMIGATLGVAVLPPAEEAKACGGCFVGQTENTQVTGHRMVLSVSLDQTTLYDQITYVGEPEEFAWVLPIRGQVDIALSSDALFQALEQNTLVQLNSPQIGCQPNFCDSDGPNFAGGGGSAEGGDDPVEIIAEEVVGPYETVQLSSSDPAALVHWLESRGYNIPDEIQPVIDAYVADDFDFLALRLVPGQGVDSMRPIAITTPGATPTLPLRMVAAGTGATTAVTLWVIGEGRYGPQNFPEFTIREQDLVWNWDEQKSNYADLKQTQFDRFDGHAWLVEAAEPLSPYAFESLLWTAEWDPASSGYADPDGENAVANAQADIARLLSGIDRGSMWITRLHAELSRSALEDDLDLQASMDQSTVTRFFFIENAVGTEPSCPPPPDCGDGSGLFPPMPGNGSGGGSSGSGGCATTPGATAPGALALAALAAAIGISRRRRRPCRQRRGGL